MPLTISDLRKDLKSKKIAPIYFFYGSEDYLIEEGIDELVNTVLDDGMKGFNFDTLYGSKASIQEVIAVASAFPMMSERRVVIVKEVEKLVTTDAAKDILASYLTCPLESTCLILVSDEVDLRKKPFTDFKKHAVLVECKSLYDNKVPDWIEHYVRKLKKSISPEAVVLLQEQVGNSLRTLASEIEKIMIYIGEKKEITFDDVTTVVGSSKGYTIFDLQNEIGKKNLSRALAILGTMLMQGENTQKIIVMLTRFFIQLWKLSDPSIKKLPQTELAEEIGVHPYFLKSMRQFESNYSAEQIEKNFTHLLKADTILKTTSRDPKIVLDLLVYSLIKEEPEAEYVLE